ncbi:hypothetical protein ACSMXN_09420 [Jatrophihabitans sp. DSM 45814]
MTAAEQALPISSPVHFRTTGSSVACGAQHPAITVTDDPDTISCPECMVRYLHGMDRLRADVAEVVRFTNPVEPPPSALAARQAATHRAGQAVRRANRAAKIVDSLAASDGGRALLSGYTAARELLDTALTDLDISLATLKKLRRDELDAAKSA